MENEKIATVNAKFLPISKKHSIAICRAIKGKTAKEAIEMLEKVAKKKKAIKFTGEIPHRKGEGMMSGRYPVNASKVFMKLIKGLVANANVKGIDAEKSTISAKADDAGKHMRAGRKRRKFKRCHVTLQMREIGEIEKK